MCRASVSASRSSIQVSQRGFTLLELLVVVAIGAMTIGLLASTFGQVSSAEVRTQSNQVASLMRQSFSYAVSHGKYLRMIFNMSDHTISVESTDDPVFLSINKRQLGEQPDALTEEEEARNEKAKEEGRALIKRASFHKETVLPEIKLKAGVQLFGVYTPNQDEVFREGRAYVHFFPNGFAEPAMIYIGNQRDDDKGLRYTLALSPLTGKITRTLGELEVDRYFGQPEEEEE